MADRSGQDGVGPGNAAPGDAALRAARAERLGRAFLAAIPHARELGLTLVAMGEGWAEVSMPWDGRLVGDPATGVIHGGAVSTLLDTASGAAVLTHPMAGDATATLGLRIDYMRPATPGQAIRARAECHHVTRSVAFVRATAHDDDAARPVAVAAGTFTLERRA